MKVLRVNLIGVLLSILGWAYVATHGSVVGLPIASLPFSDGCFTNGVCMEDGMNDSNGICTEDGVNNFNGVCIEDGMNDLTWPMPMPISMSNEGMRNDPILEPKHKIFLSHSGVQKEFVEHLCKALEDRFRYPFFDRRPESLPKGERFSELIIQAAEQCELLIVVVSDEYFMSKWPMIELNTFIKAHKLHDKSKSSINGPKILPLFYGLLVDDLKDATMQKKWFKSWETLAKTDLRNQSIVEDWKYALGILRSFNGMSYDRNSMDIVAYEEEIVSYVCETIAPDIKWDDSHVQGKTRILEVIREKINGIGVSRQYKVKVVGIYGVGGIGKTTTCKTLSNELLNEYKGRVCHIEFPIVPSSISKEFFQKVLRDLTKKSIDVIQDLNEGQCKEMLRISLIEKRTFLAIDNILDNDESMKLAKTLLELPYHPNSLVVVTARSRSILELLDLDGDAYFEMLDLKEAEAVELFLHHAASGQKDFESKEKDDIMTCVKRCYVSKGDGQGYHYHPLALQSLGLQLGFHGENPYDWVKNLPHVKIINYFSKGNPVFDIIKSSFDLLPPKDQTLFLEVGHFFYLNDHFSDFGIEWLYSVHKQDKEEILRRLESLKRKGLLVDVDLKSRRISMHELYREFAHLQAKGGSP